MWIVELLLLSLVGGTMLGVGLRLFDEWRERSNREMLQKSFIQIDTKNRQ